MSLISFGESVGPPTPCCFIPSSPIHDRVLRDVQVPGRLQRIPTLCLVWLCSSRSRSRSRSKDRSVTSKSALGNGQKVRFKSESMMKLGSHVRMTPRVLYHLDNIHPRNRPFINSRSYMSIIQFKRQTSPSLFAWCRLYLHICTQDTRINTHAVPAAFQPASQPQARPRILRCT